MKMYQSTQLQKQIEYVVTKGRGYDRINLPLILNGIENSEIALQTTLANMDLGDGKFTCYVNGFIIDLNLEEQLLKMIRELEKEGTPLSNIADADGFREAFDSAFPYARLAGSVKMPRVGLLRLTEVNPHTVGKGQDTQHPLKFNLDYPWERKKE